MPQTYEWPENAAFVLFLICSKADNCTTRQAYLNLCGAVVRECITCGHTFWGQKIAGAEMHRTRLYTKLVSRICFCTGNIDSANVGMTRNRCYSAALNMQACSQRPSRVMLLHGTYRLCCAHNRPGVLGASKTSRGKWGSNRMLLMCSSSPRVEVHARSKVGEVNDRMTRPH